MTINTNTDMRAALIEARDWFESQAKAVSKGCGSSYELHDLRTQRDALDAALAAPAQAVAHDALRCMVGNCKFNGEVDKHATGCSAAASNEEALLKALTEATRSLETIQLMAGKDDYLQDMAQVRAYATSRAMVANAAIAASDDALIAREFHESQEDSLLICASDLQHSAIYDNHAEMQSCLRAVADRILSLASPAQAVPASIITASVMRDDGGEHPAFCLMVAYRAEKDAMTALAMLTDEPAQAAAPTLGGYTHADVTAAPAKPVAWALKWPGDDRLNLSTVFDTKAEATEYLHRCQAGVTVIPLYDSPQLAAATVTAAPTQASEYPELPDGLVGAILGAAYDFRDAHLAGSKNLKCSAHVELEATVIATLRAARGAAQAATIDADVQALIDSAPAPFRRLGKFLASTLDEDQWATAERLLLGGLVAVQEGRDIQGDIDHYNENMG